MDIRLTNVKSNLVPFAGLALITVLGAALRFYRLGDWSLWNDEAHTIEAALGGIQNDLAGRSIYYPLNFLLTQVAFELWGVSEWSARLFPAFFGILTIPLVYLLAKEMFDEKIGALAALFLALFTWHIDWSQNARYYTLECFLAALAVLLFYKGVHENRPGLLWISPLVLMLSVLAHPSAAFLVIALMVYLGIVFYTNPQGLPGLKRNALLFAAPFVLIGLVLLPWYIALPTLLLKERGAVSSPWYVLMNVSYHVQIPFLFLGLASALALVLKKDHRGILAGCCIGIPLLLLLMASTRTLAYGSYVLFTLPFFCILTAYGIVHLLGAATAQNRVLAYGVAFGLVAALLSSNYLYFFYENGNRARWKEAALYLKSFVHRDHVVFASEGSTVYFYLGDSSQVYWMSWFDKMREQLADKTVWFLVYNEDSKGLKPSVREFLRARCAYVAGFTSNTSVKIRDINIYTCNGPRSAALAAARMRSP